MLLMLVVMIWRRDCKRRPRQGEAVEDEDDENEDERMMAGERMSGKAGRVAVAKRGGRGAANQITVGERSERNGSDTALRCAVTVTVTVTVLCCSGASASWRSSSSRLFLSVGNQPSRDSRDSRVERDRVQQ